MDRTLDPATPPDGATFVERWDDSAASRARRHHAATGQRTSPWGARPERESYTERETFRLPDGSLWVRERAVHRWGGSWSMGDWSMV